MIGTIKTATREVTQTNTAKAVGSGSLEVFATPMMVALMEEAACLAIADMLEEGQTSVGTKISVEHTAASLVSQVVSATAVITNVDGRSVEFELAASDKNGEIGKGTHTRFIVNEDKFISKLKEK